MHMAMKGEQLSVWRKYRNGNYTVSINTRDGTKIRETEEDEFIPEFAENMDIKICDRCSMGCKMCFPAGTKVLMGDYTYKNIENLKSGDEVIGFREKPSKTETKRKIFKTRVKRTFVREAEDLVKITVDDGTEIVATRGHPFLAVDREGGIGRFKKLESVEEGTGLYKILFPIRSIDCSTGRNRDYTRYTERKVVKKEELHKKVKVYNLETESHTYIANNFLVHNCHEGSTPDGELGDLNAAFVNTLKPYQEVALGGGNVLEHQGLISFLEKLRDRKVFANITLNQVHFEQNRDIIKTLTDRKLVYGIGVSLVNPTDELIRMLGEFPNAVLHVINGIVTKEQIEKLKGHDLKMLILGYKRLRRGEDYYKAEGEAIEGRKKWLYGNLGSILPEFKVVSFDNLAIEQLDVKRFLSPGEWEEFYMGDDGGYTFYIDMVKKEFAESSTAPFDKRYPLMDDVVDMFNVIRRSKETDRKNRPE